MNSVRPKSAVFKFKVWLQKRNQNLFCNLAQHTTYNFTHRWSSRRQNDIKFGEWKDKTISTTFMKTTCYNSDVSNDISSRQELEGYPPRPPEALLNILAISRALVIQMLWQFMGGKIRWFPTTCMGNILPNSDCINVISSSQNAWVLLFIKSTKSIVGHYINNQLPNE